MDTPDEPVPMKSNTGKQILAHAMQQDHCVLEFERQADGTHNIVDITEHVEQLERKVNNAG